MILVYVDDLLIAAQDQEEGEAFLSKLQAIWKMKVTGRIPCRKKGALEFLGRTIYRSKDGESALYFGVFFCWRLLGLIPGGAPFSQLSSGVKDAMVVFTRLVKCQLMTKTCRKAG